MSKLPLSSQVLVLAYLGLRCLQGQPLEVVTVRSETVQRTAILPGEILPYQRVSLHARANGYIERILVDRGAAVQQGQLLAELVAPELNAATAQAEARVQQAEASRAEAQARLESVVATYERLKAASSTPGAIAGNELVQAEKTVEASRALVRSSESAIRSAQAALQAAKQSESYLRVVAPFSGVITERFVHPGALVGPGNGSAGALVELQQVSRLRLVVGVPEADAASVRTGIRVEFSVPAFPGRKFFGSIARMDRSLDPKTRTMPVELDILNPRNELSPGMYPQVSWPSRGVNESLLVPPTAVVTTTERTFVIRVVKGKAEWVSVKKGALSGEMLQVMGSLAPGDLVVRRGSDEIREGSPLQIKQQK